MAIFVYREPIQVWLVFTSDGVGVGVVSGVVSDGVGVGVVSGVVSDGVGVVVVSGVVRALMT